MQTLPEYEVIDSAVSNKMMALSVPEKLKLMEKVTLAGRGYDRSLVASALNQTFPEELTLVHEGSRKVSRSVLLLERWIIFQ